VCQDCRTTKDTVRGVVHELVTDLLLPLFLYAIPVGLLIVTGTLKIG